MILETDRQEHNPTSAMIYTYYAHLPFSFSQTSINKMPTEKKQVKAPFMGTRYSEVSTSETSGDVDVVWNIDLESKRQRFSRRWWLAPYLLHTFLLIVYTTIFIIAYNEYSRGPPVVDELGIPYIQQVFEVNPALNESIARLYTGPPSEELEEAWDKLLQCKWTSLP